jgi:hypothetical protein
MTAEPKLLFAAACGALTQELVYWYDIRNTLTAPEYRILIKSITYWIVTTAMVAMSTAGTWLWFDNTNVDARHYLILGASFPLLFKASVASSTKRRAKLGGSRESRLAMYFLKTYRR